MRLILIRHGETKWNRQQRLQGWLDSPLTEQAIRQLQSLKLDRLNNPVIYCSDLGRAISSAQIVANNIGCRVISDSRLRERYFGLLEGQVIDEGESLSVHWKAYHNRYQQRIDKRLGLESEEAFEARILSFMAELAQNEIKGDVILMGHGEWLRALSNLNDNRPSWHQGAGVMVNGAPLGVDIPSGSRSDEPTQT